MSMVVLFLVLTAVAIAAPRYGVDSRTPTRALRRTSPVDDLVAIGRRLRRSVLTT
jgi:hypothetical protein